MNSVCAADRNSKFEKAVSILQQSVASGQVRAAAIFVQSGETQLNESFGDAKTPDASFLLGSISKPIAMTALMTLFDKGLLKGHCRHPGFLNRARNTNTPAWQFCSPLKLLSGCPG